MATIIGKFGTNTISHNEYGSLIIDLTFGGSWVFSYEDVSKLGNTLRDFINGKKGTKREFWRTDGSGLIRLELGTTMLILDAIYLRENNREGYFWTEDLSELLKGISLLLSNPKFSQSMVQEKLPRENVPHEDLISQTNSNNQVFIVHGHNQGTLQTVARYIESLECKAIVLHEQPNLGRTIIEKFIESSKVGYAVVLLTADDRGGLVDLPFDQQKFRARQNVILELGFFMGKLGRERVCALCEENIEIPSDYSGVLYIAIDKIGAWKIQLAKELKHAGINIDTSKLLS